MSVLQQSMDPTLAHSLPAPHKEVITTVAFHPSPTFLSHRKLNAQNRVTFQLAYGSVDGNITINNITENQQQEKKSLDTKKSRSGDAGTGDDVRSYKFHGHTDAINEITYSPGGSLLASASSDKTVRIWVPKINGGSTLIKGHNGPVRGVDFSHHYHHLSRPISSVEDCEGAESEFESNSHSLLLTCSDDKLVKVWSLPSKTFQCSLVGHKNWVQTCKFSPDASSSHLAASGSDDGTVRLWDVNTGTNVVTYSVSTISGRSKASVNHVGSGGTLGVKKIAFHPLGSIIAASLTDGSVQMYDLRSDECIQTFFHPPRDKRRDSDIGSATCNVAAIAFRPNDNHFMTSQKVQSKNYIHDGAHDKLLFHLWDMRVNKKIFTADHDQAQQRSVTNINKTSTNLPPCCAFSADGGRFATGSSKSLLVWDLDNSSINPKTSSECGASVEIKKKSEKFRPSSSRIYSKIKMHVKKSPKVATPSPRTTTGHMTSSPISSPDVSEMKANNDETSLSPDKRDSNEKILGTLDHVVGQLDLLAKTVALIDKRLSLQEDAVRAISEKLLKKDKRTPTSNY